MHGRVYILDFENCKIRYLIFKILFSARNI